MCIRDSFHGLWINGARIECHHLFVFGFGVRELFLSLVQQAGGEMGLGIFRCELGDFAVSLECVFGLFIFEQMCERKPGAGLTFFGMSCGFEVGGSAQELLGLGIIGAG